MLVLWGVGRGCGSLDPQLFASGVLSWSPSLLGFSLSLVGRAQGRRCPLILLAPASSIASASVAALLASARLEEEDVDVGAGLDALAVQEQGQPVGRGHA
jgi:hypothetical protein